MLYQENFGILSDLIPQIRLPLSDYDPREAEIAFKELSERERKKFVTALACLTNEKDAREYFRKHIDEAVEYYVLAHRASVLVVSYHPDFLDRINSISKEANAYRRGNFPRKIVHGSGRLIVRLILFLGDNLGPIVGSSIALFFLFVMGMVMVHDAQDSAPGVQASGKTFSSEDCDKLRTQKTERSSLENTSFQGCDLSQLSFDNADLTLSNASETTFAGSSFVNTEMSQVSYEDVDFTSANLYSVELDLANLSGASFDFVEVTYSNFSYAQLDGVTATNAKFSSSIFQGTSLVSADLRESEWAYSTLYSVDFSQADLTGAEFRSSVSLNDRDETQISNVNFNGANLTGAEFSEIKIESVNFQSANMSGVRFEDVIFENILFACEQIPEIVVVNAQSLPIPEGCEFEPRQISE